MDSIRDILDSTLSLGFQYFVGDDIGYLRYLLHSPKSLEAIQAILEDDIDFIKSIDKDYLDNEDQVRYFKSLAKYIKQAKEYIDKKVRAKKAFRKNEEIAIKGELKALQDELRTGLIDQDEYDYSKFRLEKPDMDDLTEVKNKFAEIDKEVKKKLDSELKKYEEREFEFTEDDLKNLDELEPKKKDLDKIERGRNWSMREFTEITDEILLQEEQNNPLQQQQAIQKQKQTAQFAQKNKNDMIKKHQENLNFLKKMGVMLKPGDDKDMQKVQQLIDGLANQ